MSDECLRCGVCCFSNLESYVQVSGDDHERLGEDAERLVHFIGNRAYMKMIEGHCAALRVAPSGRYECTVYERRPEICRALERGSPQCRGEIAEKGERPLAALHALRLSW